MEGAPTSLLPLRASTLILMAVAFVLSGVVHGALAFNSSTCDYLLPRRSDRAALVDSWRNGSHYIPVSRQYFLTGQLDHAFDLLAYNTSRAYQVPHHNNPSCAADLPGFLDPCIYQLNTLPNVNLMQSKFLTDMAATDGPQGCLPLQYDSLHIGSFNEVKLSNDTIKLARRSSVNAIMWKMIPVPVFWFDLQGVETMQGLQKQWKKTPANKGLNPLARVHGYSSVVLYKGYRKCVNFTATLEAGADISPDDVEVRLYQDDKLVLPGYPHVTLQVQRESHVETVATVCFDTSVGATGDNYILTFHYNNQHTASKQVEQTLLHYFRVNYIYYKSPPYLCVAGQGPTCVCQKGYFPFGSGKLMCRPGLSGDECTTLRVPCGLHQQCRRVIANGTVDYTCFNTEWNGKLVTPDVPCTMTEKSCTPYQQCLPDGKIDGQMTYRCQAYETVHSRQCRGFRVYIVTNMMDAKTANQMYFDQKRCFPLTKTQAMQWLSDECTMSMLQFLTVRIGQPNMWVTEGNTFYIWDTVNGHFVTAHKGDVNPLVCSILDPFQQGE